MNCKVCGGELTPIKDVVSVSGTGTHCVPCWTCEDCEEIRYVRTELELNVWVSQYISIGDYCPEDCDTEESAYSEEEEEGGSEGRDFEDIDEYYNYNDEDKEDSEDEEDNY